MPANPKTLAEARILLAAILDDMVECVRAAPNGALPSGHLYAAVMGAIPIDIYELMITKLIRDGRITRTHHLLQVPGHSPKEHP